MAAPKKTRSKPRKPKLSLVAADGPLQVRSPSEQQLASFGRHGGWRVADTGRIVVALGVEGGYELGYLDPDATDATRLEGIATSHAEPRATTDGRRVVVDDKQRKVLVEVDLDAGTLTDVYEYGRATFIIADYVSPDMIAFLWGANELWTLYRQPDGSFEPGETLQVSNAYGLTTFLGRFALLHPESGKTSYQVVAFRGTNVAVIGKLTLDGAAIEIRDGQAIVEHDKAPHAIDGLNEIWDTLPDRPPLRATGYTGNLPPGPAAPGPLPEHVKTDFPEAKSLIGATRSGRCLCWVPGSPPSYVWRDLDGTRHALTNEWSAMPPDTADMQIVSTEVHPTQDRILTYFSNRPWDLQFPPRARCLWKTGGAWARYVGDGRIAVLADHVLYLLADDDALTELGRLDCPDHDNLFVVRYGIDVLTSGPPGASAARLYAIADQLALRGDIEASGAAKAYAKAFKEAGGRLSGVREVRSGYGRHFALTTMGNFELQGL